VTTGKHTTQALRVVAETAPRPDLVVVLGMHRAGTSALARGLKALGVELGDRMMAPSATENPTGYWEDLDIYELNMSMMKALGRDWHSLHATTSTDVEYLKRGGYMLRASELLRSKTQDTRTFGFKDPRLAVLLPFWKEVFSARLYEVAYLIAVRNPLSVTRSLATRNALASEKSYYLWLEHMLPSLEMKAGARRIVMDYDCLMAAPREQLQRMADAFGMELDEAEVAKYESEFLDASLRHTEYTEADLELDPACPPLVADVYRELHALARLPGSLGSDQLASKLTSWQRDLGTLQPALNFADSVLGKLESATRDLDSRQSEAAELQRGLHTRSAELEEARQTLSTLSVRTLELETALEAQSATMDEIAQRDAAIAELRHEVDALRATATDGENLIRELQQELDSSRHAAADSTSALQQAQQNLSASRDEIAQREAALSELQHGLLAEKQSAAERDALMTELQLEIGVLRDSATARDGLIRQLQGDLESSRHALAQSASAFQRLMTDQEAAFLRASNAEVEQERLRAALLQARSDAAVQATLLERGETALARIRGDFEASREAATRREELVAHLQHELETSQHAVARANAERDALVRRVEAEQRAASQRAAEDETEHRRMADALVKAQRDAASQSTESERALAETREREESLRSELGRQASELTREREQADRLVEALAERDASIETLRAMLDTFDASLEELTLQSIELDRQIAQSAERHISDMAVADESLRAMTARHDAARQELAAANTGLETHTNALAALNLDVHELRQRSALMEQENARLRDKLRLGNGETSELRGRIDDLKTTTLDRMNLVGRQLTDERLAKEEFLRLLIDANTRIDQLRRSWSWRMTAPFRALVRRRSR
jgi:hypothetical protein